MENEGVGERKIRVLVVDDSVLMSRQISSILASAGGIEVVGRAKDGVEAVAMVKELMPDVVTLDVEMPRMNGITALKHIMIRHAVPAVMISALTTEGARATFDSFKYGAVDVVAKPSRREDVDLAVQKAEIVAKVRRAAAISPSRLRYIRIASVNSGMPREGLGNPDDATRFIVVGTGVGGNYTLLKVVPPLPESFSSVLIAVIQLPSRYLDLFVSFLQAHCRIPVRAANKETVVEKGVCYVTSGQEALILSEKAAGRLVLTPVGSRPNSGPDEQGLIDEVFRSVARLVGPRAVGVVMSGAGRDGAEGLEEIRKQGGLTVVQEINNCTDPSMPLAALEKGFVERILPDYHMADFLIKVS